MKKGAILIIGAGILGLVLVFASKNAAAQSANNVAGAPAPGTSYALGATGLLGSIEGLASGASGSISSLVGEALGGNPTSGVAPSGPVSVPGSSAGINSFSGISGPVGPIATDNNYGISQSLVGPQVDDSISFGDESYYTDLSNDNSFDSNFSLD